MNMEIKVISVGIRHPGNLGAIARLCDNYNVSQLILVQPECEITDESYERAIRGRRFLDDAVILDKFDDIRDYVDFIVGLSARTGGNKNLTRSPFPIHELQDRVGEIKGSIGFVLGRENFGLHNDEVSQCDVLCYIPLPGSNPVFNISHALAVALWEFIRDWDFDLPVEHRLMTGEEKRAFFGFLEKILDHTWMGEEQYYAIIKVYQSILGRAVVTKREANTLIGTLRAILKRLENPDAEWD